MAETSDQIQQHIQQTRLELNENINELQQKVKSTMDWRTQFEEHPLALMGLALGAGVVLSVLLPSHNGRYRSRRLRSDSDVSGVDAARYSSAPSRRRYSMSRSTQETWDSLKGALAGVATSRLSQYLDRIIPGFKQEFTRARTGRPDDIAGIYGSDSSNWRESSAIGGN